VIPLVVGVTGGIGSGKTAVAGAFADLGVEIIDTDELAHKLTAPGQPALQEIVIQFGNEVLTVQGALDRAALRRKVFADPRERRRLEMLLHPLIKREVDRLLKQARGPYVVLVVPLLVETGAYAGMLGRVLVVDCPVETQVARAMRRSGLARDEVEAIVRAQASRSERLARADDVLVNDGDLCALRAKVRQFHLAYLALAGASAGQ
jgi:dephospho-CoA kinase